MHFKSILHIPTSFCIKRYINWITSDKFGCIIKVQSIWCVQGQLKYWF